MHADMHMQKLKELQQRKTITRDYNLVWCVRLVCVCCVVWKGFPAFPAHLRMRPVSRGNSRRATCQRRGTSP